MKQPPDNWQQMTKEELRQWVAENCKCEECGRPIDLDCFTIVRDCLEGPDEHYMFVVRQQADLIHIYCKDHARQPITHRTSLPLKLRKSHGTETADTQRS